MIGSNKLVVNHAMMKHMLAWYLNSRMFSIGAGAQRVTLVEPNTKTGWTTIHFETVVVEKKEP